MSNAIILHGKLDPGDEEYYNPNFPAASNSHWLPWLQKQLMIRDIYTQTPEIPNAWNPEYATWQKEFERYDITPETVLVGHSCGAGFIVRWLCEHPEVSVGKVVLVAPSLGLDWDAGDFFEFTYDEDLLNRVQAFTIFYSSDDRPAITTAVETISGVYPKAKLRKFEGYGHFTFDTMKTEAFPELVQEIIGE